MMIKVFRYLSLAMVLFVFSNFTFGQFPGCPSVNAGADVNLDCSNPCANLTATPFNVGATTSYNVQSIPHNPPISYSEPGGTGISVGIDDTWSPAITLPFTFCFYGQTYNKCVVGSNGAIKFGASAANGYHPFSFTASCPSTSLTNAGNIFGIYHDIDPSVSGTVKWYLLGAAPCRIFVVVFNELPLYTSPGYNCDNKTSTHMMVLYETTNAIDVYVDHNETCDWNDGNAVIGIQNNSGSAGVAAPGRNTGPWTVTTPEAWRFLPSGNAIYSVEWLQGGNVIASGNTVSVCPTVSTTYTARATYTTCDGQTIVEQDSTVVNPFVGGVSVSEVSNTPESCGAANGEIQVLASGGTPGYTYSIDNVNFQSSATFSNLAAATYTVYAKDAAGCVGLVDVEVLNNSTLTLDFSSVQQISCFGANNGQATIVAANGQTPYQYSLNGGSNVQSPNFQNLQPGLNTFTVFDANGCSETIDTVITQPVKLLFSQFTVTNVGCTGGNGQIQVNTQGGIPPYSYTLNGSASQPTGSFIGLQAGDYNVVVTDANGCQKDSLVTVLGNVPIAASVSSTPNSACLGCNYSGPSIMINEINIYPTVGDGSIYGIGIDPVTEGEWIELYNPNWCDSVDISGYILGSYNSSGDAISIPYASNGMAFVIPNGTKVPPLGFAVVRGRNAPVPPTDVVDVVVDNTSNNLCIDGGIADSRLWFADFGGWFAFYDASGVPQDMISWGTPTPSDLDGEPCIPPSNSLPASVTQLDSYNAAGIGENLGLSSVGMTYSRIPDGGPWSSVMAAEDFSYGTCNDPLNCLSETGVIVCNGTGTVNVTSGNAPYTYAWNDPLSQTSSTASGLCAGAYDVVVTDAGGCSETYSVTVEEDVFTIDATIQDPSCNTPNGSITVLATSSTPTTYSYNWSVNTGITNTTSSVANNLGAGTYSVSVSNSACVRDTTLILVAPAAIDSVLVNTLATTCGLSNGSVTVAQVYGGTAPYQYNFNSSGSGNSTSYTSLASGSYGLQVTDNQGCIYNINAIPVAPSSGIADIAADKVFPNCGKADGEISIISVLGGASPYTYYLNSVLQVTSVFEQLPGGQYVVNVEDANGCQYSETIVLGETGELYVHVPNVFTPNGDNVNDTWQVTSSCVSKLHCVILNRWGNLVHEFDAIDGKWDGKSNGDKVDDGVYFYKLDVEYTSGEKETFHGNITVNY